MKEFRILLIDDDLIQGDLLKGAVNNFNKKRFVNDLKEKSIITNEKASAKLLKLDDEKEVYKNLADDFRKNNKIEDLIEVLVTYKHAKTAEEAMVLLYEEDFNVLIIDLSLNGKGINEEYEGNSLSKNILNKEIIPIIVRTGFPKMIDKELEKNIVKCYPKETPTLEQIIEELLEFCNDPAFKIFGSKGQVNKCIKEFFWDLLPECFKNKKEEINNLDTETQKKVIIRYVSNWLNKKYIYNDEYLSVEPMEMYMFPNPIEQICNCDIYEDIDSGSKEKFIVLTPTCDLANHKAENILFAKIRSFDEERFEKRVEAMKSVSNSKKKEAESWFRNSHKESMKYHFLPKVSFFEGGFIDFSSLICLAYDKEKNKFEERDLRKIGTITDAFKKDIIARFSSYYQRQGQPTFNTESVLKNFKTNCEE